MALLYQSLQELENARVPKGVFIAKLKTALEQRQGFAAGKIGYTEAQLLRWLMQREQKILTRKLHILEVWVKKNALEYAGLFPPDVSFYAEYARLFLAAVRELDVMGLWGKGYGENEFQLINYFGLENMVTRFQNLHPDRSIPDDPTQCYLPMFRGKRILIVNPFGNLLAARATRKVFEGVWSSSGKKFFDPASVEGLEFPYGFAHETWTRYATALDLMQEIEAEIERRDFDVALIGAGGLGIPLAAHVKKMGKVGIMLGGHLQVLFGVKGRRWKETAVWRDTYFNEWWIDMPEQYRPKAGDITGDYSYW